MRAILLATLLLAATMAGCTSDDEPDHDNDHTTTTTTTTGPGPGNNTTVPNDPPVLALSIKNGTGVEQNYTNVGGSLVFDAAASSDPDGNITDLALIVTDSNSTRSALFIQDGVLRTQEASFTFDKPGVVDLLLNGIDDQGALSQMSAKAYVNHPQMPASFKLNLALESTADATDCASPTKGPDGANIAETQGWKAFTFDVQANASFATARVATGQAEIAFCTPEGEPISAQADETGFIVTNPDATLVVPNGTQAYYVSALSGAPNQDVQVEIVVHYEPRPAEITEFY